jgi:hypothetical protein
MKKLIAISKVLDTHSVGHRIVVASNTFQNDFAKILYANTDDADAEVGDSDDFGWFVYFEFRAGGFDKWLAKQTKELKKFGVSDAELEAQVAAINKKVGNTSSGFVAILCEDSDNKVTVEYYKTSAGKTEWASIEKNYEAFEDMESEDDSEEYDPETDEIEEEDDK